MADAYHIFGQDWVVSASGDLLMTQNSQDETTQRVLRRLFTNPGAYVWNLSYGAGLPAQIGQPTQPGTLKAVTLQQMQLEAGVAQTPAPTVAVTSNALGYTGISVTYTDAVTRVTVPLTLPLSG